MVIVTLGFWSDSRRFSFKLKTVFIILVLVAILLVFVVNTLQKRNAAEWVRAHHGELKYSEPSNVPKWLIDLIGIDFFANIVEVRLDGHSIDNLEPLSPLTSLKRLFVDGSYSSNFKPISNLNNLRELYLTRMDLGDLASLSELRHLRVLYVEPETAEELDLFSISKIVGLEEFYCTLPPETCKLDFDSVHSLTKLKKFCFSGYANLNCSVFLSMKNLEEVRIHFSHLASLAAMTELPKLRILELEQVTFAEDSESRLIRQKLLGCRLLGSSLAE